MSADLFLLLFGMGVGLMAGVVAAGFLWRKRYTEMRAAYMRVLSAWAAAETQHHHFLQAMGREVPRA